MLARLGHCRIDLVYQARHLTATSAEEMRSQHGEHVLVVLVTMILMKYVAAASRHHAVSDDVDIRPCGSPPNTDCQSSRNVPTVAARSDDVKDSLESRHVDSGEATVLGRWEERGKMIDGGRLTGWRDPGGGRPRRSVRPSKSVELRETSRGKLLSLGTDYAERFAFKDPVPTQLHISAVMGNVLLRDGHRLDYETEPEVDFVVIVTRVDDVACEYSLFLSGIVSVW